jgi:hypothetical protein
MIANVRRKLDGGWYSLRILGDKMSLAVRRSQLRRDADDVMKTDVSKFPIPDHASSTAAMIGVVEPHFCKLRVL